MAVREEVMKTYIVSVKKEEFYFYSVDAENDDQAEEIARDQLNNEVSYDDRTEFDIKEEVTK